MPTTKKKVDQAILDKNLLHQYASYNYLFTLSGLTEDQLKKPSDIIGPKPHDIIARSAGIGDPSTTVNNTSKVDNKTLNENEQSGLAKAQSVLNQGRDIYFESVDIQSVHSFNPSRRSSSIGKIRMILNEPTGVTILEKLKATAYNCGYKDHVEAPYLLSLEFRGFNEHGNSEQLDPNKGRKWIPIKIINIQIKVNTSGARYEVEAIPYNESGFLNKYNYTRTSISLDKATDIGAFLNHITTQLNKQNQDEAEKEQMFTPSMQDTYVIKIDDTFSSLPLQVNTRNNQIATVPTDDYAKIDITDPDTSFNKYSTPPQTYKFGATAGAAPAGTAIIKILEEAMLSLQPIQTVVDNWITKIIAKLANDHNEKPLTNLHFENLDDKDYYVNWFMIKSKIDTKTGALDRRTMQHPKTITYYIEPYRIHVYRLVKPGITFGSAASIRVKKKYEYIFTGQNTDILDLDINYKVAYYQTKLKLEAPSDGNIGIKPVEFLLTSGPDTDLDNGLGIRSYAGGVRTSSIIRGTESKSQADLFMDALANPQADMVKVDLKILGDPAWIGMSQFFDINLKDKAPGTGTTTDEKRKELGADTAWNTIYGCFNVETHDPIVRLNFIMPGDLNEIKGRYEIGGTNSSAFSGLYQVYKVTSNFIYLIQS